MIGQQMSADKLTCPKCGSMRLKVASTPAPGVRRRKCQDCGHAFKTLVVVQEREIIIN